MLLRCLRRASRGVLLAVCIRGGALSISHIIRCMAAEKVVFVVV